MKLIELHLFQISELCRLHNVKKLSVFGSILTERFDNDSDVDLLVDFNSQNIDDYVSNYFKLKEALEKLLKRNIDLLEEKGIKNKFIINNINRTKRVIYG